MIEVTVKEEEKTVEKIDFPVLMKSINSGQIVLFTSKHRGCRLHGGDENMDIGWYAERWESCYDNSIWQKYEGEITLKNK